MAKFTTVGFVAKKKDKPNEVYFKVSNDVKLSKGTYLNIKKKPTPEEIENAKSDKAAATLAKIAENWPEWKLSELVLVENDAE